MTPQAHHGATIDGNQPTVGREHRHALPAFGSWLNIYDAPPPRFIQICWADGNGRMPWDDGCDPAVAAIQPVLADGAHFAS